MGKIKNKNYRKFLDAGLIDIIDQRKIELALLNIKGKYRDEGRALLIALYYTGARPIEVLHIKAKDIQKQDSYVTVHLYGAKRGLNRTLFFPYRLRLVKELYSYAMRCFPDMFIFHHYKSQYHRKVIYKSGKVVNRIDETDKLRYHVKKWFKGVIPDSITPYFLRHNRFSQLSESGISPQDLQMLKGSKTSQSVQYYLHLSTKSAKAIAKKIK